MMIQEGGLLRKYSNNVKHHHATTCICIACPFILFFFHTHPLVCAILSVFPVNSLSPSNALSQNDIILSYYYQVHSWCNERSFIVKLSIDWMSRASWTKLIMIKKIAHQIKKKEIQPLSIWQFKNKTSVSLRRNKQLFLQWISFICNLFQDLRSLSLLPIVTNFSTIQKKRKRDRQRRLTSSSDRICILYCEYGRWNSQEKLLFHAKDNTTVIITRSIINVNLIKTI